jgi:hypothetical protein
MNSTKSITRNFEVIAWGALFIWWGITVMIPSLPNGSTALGTGLILIGVNVARKVSGVPVNGFSTTIGILALVWGLLEIVGVLINLPFELPIFALLLIVLGLIILAPEFKSKQAQ